MEREAGEIWRALVELIHSWEYTLSHCHIPLCCMLYPSVSSLPELPKTGSTPLDTASVPLLVQGICTAVPTTGKACVLQDEGGVVCTLSNNLL